MNPTAAGNFDIIKSFLNVAQLGASWVMWLMVALAVVLTALVLERLRLYVTTQVDAPTIGRQLLEHLEHGELDKARKLVSRGRGMEERVVADGLAAWQRGPRAAEQIMKSSLQRERQRYERFLGAMGTLGSNAPFIGLLGTVIGIVVSFQELASNPKGGMAVVGPGIAEALVSTAVGLLVAIPAVLAFNSFKGAVANRIGNVEFLTGILLASLDEEGR
jgi:biopolymer transport protein ExbB/TolQ